MIMINHLFQWEWSSRWQNVPACACNIKGPLGFACICALSIYGFAGLAVVHLSNPAVRICRQVISTLRLEHRWISPKTICLFSNSNHLHLQTWYIHICQRWYHGCFLHCSSIGIHSSNPFSPSPSYRADAITVLDKNVWWWMVMDEGMSHRWMSPQKNCIFQLKPNILPQPASFS